MVSHNFKQDEVRIFFIAGAAKSGTTSLYNYLSEHPDVHMCPYKDVVCFYCHDYGMPVTKKEYTQMLLPEGNYHAAGDVCHAYLTDKGSAGRIYNDFPSARIIIILRNPADRAFSMYHWLVCHGYEYADNFEKALELEHERIARNLRKDPRLIQGWKENYLYFFSGLYSEQIERYQRRFPPSSILYLKYEDLYCRTKEMMRELFKFIGINDNYIPDMARHNKGKRVYSVALQYWMRKKLSRIMPESLTAKLLRLNTYNIDSFDYRPETRKKLVENYKKDILETQKLTGLNLSEWLV